MLNITAVMSLATDKRYLAKYVAGRGEKSSNVAQREAS